MTVLEKIIKEYQDAANALACNVSFDLHYGDTLAPRTLENLAAYRAASGALHAELMAGFPNRNIKVTNDA